MLSCSPTLFRRTDHSGVDFYTYLENGRPIKWNDLPWVLSNLHSQPWIVLCLTVLFVPLFDCLPITFWIRTFVPEQIFDGLWIVVLHGSSVFCFFGGGLFGPSSSRIFSDVFSDVARRFFFVLTLACIRRLKDVEKKRRRLWCWCRTGIYDTKTNIGASSSKPTSILFQNKQVRPQWGHSIASPPPPKLRSPEKSRACVGSMRVALWHGCA